MRQDVGHLQETQVTSKAGAGSCIISEHHKHVAGEGKTWVIIPVIWANMSTLYTTACPVESFSPTEAWNQVHPLSQSLWMESPWSMVKRWNPITLILFTQPWRTCIWAEIKGWQSRRPQSNMGFAPAPKKSASFQPDQTTDFHISLQHDQGESNEKAWEHWAPHPSDLPAPKQSKSHWMFLNPAAASTFAKGWS